MSDVERRFHETWLGMVQPIEGLVVSVPVLVDAQCMERLPPTVQERLVEVCPPTRIGEVGPEGHRISAPSRFLEEVLGFSAASFDAGDALPEELSLYVPEGKQTLRPTFALKKIGYVATPEGADATPASKAGARYEMLLWDLGEVAGGVALDLDKPETVTGTWDYPPAAKLDRLLRHCRVPIGLLTNREVVRLVYAPHGESSGSITFRLEDMVSVGGRPILDAFVMLLSANRFFGVAEDRTLSAILAESRKRQANVTNELADQVFEALQILLRGFEAAAERDGRALIDDALEREGDHLYKGLLTVLLRIVFVLYAEDRGLLPVENEAYERNLSLLALFDELQADHGAYPDSMSRRFGAYGRLVSVFRAIFLGVSHGNLQMPPRRGSLFDPHQYPFLEGWGPAGSAPVTQPEDRADVHLPSVDDETVFRVLEKLLMFEGQRLSYRALDVEQIGSVYEALMGYHVIRTTAPSMCMRPDRLWVSADEVLEVPPARRAKWIKETIGLSAAQAEKLNADLNAGDALGALAKFAAGGKKHERDLAKAKAGQLVLQPGTERRRTSSHYTPRSLSAPIVRRTIEPLLAVMGDAPQSERILRLKICDPAMGSGAFLVEACRFLADHVLAAWTRERRIEEIAKEHGDPLLHARRLVAQRCLYGVDKNDAAVELAKLSLWLVTLSKTLPFTFLDHSLRHGDSLVGLDFDQLRAFHWKRPDEKDKGAPKQLELFGREIAMALDEAIALRQQIGDLGDSPRDDREKARLYWDAQDALDRVRLIGDLVVGAFFAHDKDKDREKERACREELVRTWLASGGSPSEELLAMQREIRARLPVFHWMAELPEVFYAERPDPLDGEEVNRAAYMDAYLGNPPFLGGTIISTVYGGTYLDWLSTLIGARGNRADLAVYFFRRASALLGSHGTIGLIATNAIAEGDTREHGLKALLETDHCIYSAVDALLWPGAANVAVAVVHLAKGRIRSVVGADLNDVPVPMINSQLTARPERSEPHRLQINASKSFTGAKIYGQGFLLTPSERDELIRQDPENASRIFPYVGGEEVNSLPGSGFDRYVIDFGDSSLPEAQRWPLLLDIVRERVKPERDRTADNADGRILKQYWWRFFRRRSELSDALGGLKACLVNSQVSKHLLFAFQPVDRVFAHTLNIYPLDCFTPFAVLQARAHETWARLLSSSFGSSSTSGPVLRYTPSTCFETFPFPQAEPSATLDGVERIGRLVHDARSQYAHQEAVGLTILYNRIKDPACTERHILELRKLHEEMDRAVLAAYVENDPGGRWNEIEVPPYCPISDADRKKLEAFEDAVIDRLFALNAKRAEEERLRGAANSASPSRANGRSRAAKKKSGTAEQLTLGDAASQSEAPRPKRKMAKTKVDH